MTTVFIGGSRRITRLNEDIRFRAGNIISKKMRVLVGDANGADRAMQQYFVNRGYENVVVYCMGERCRNNLGNWPTKNISSARRIKDFAYYSTKDMEMAREASYGFMIWDGKSIGTLNNILNLLNQKKRVLVYFSINKSYHTLTSLREFQFLFDQCERIDRQRFDRVLLTAQRAATEEPHKGLFSRREHAKLKECSTEASHVSIASMNWLLSVGAKI